MAHGQPGRPKTTEEQFKLWLEDMRPHLVLGCSLNRAMEKSGLLDGHEFVIREKYNVGDWFSRKVDAYRATPGENANEAYVRIISKILDKAKTDTQLTHDETEMLKHFSEKHRTAQPFFVTRNEVGEAKREDLGKILDIKESDYDEFGETTTTKDNAAAEKQEVATDPSVQNQEQGRAAGDVQTEQNPAQAPTGTPQPPPQPHP